jgi:hypothetical protein
MQYCYLQVSPVSPEAVVTNALPPRLRKERPASYFDVELNLGMERIETYYESDGPRVDSLSWCWRDSKKLQH